jgi:hypothetical protein
MKKYVFLGAIVLLSFTTAAWALPSSVPMPHPGSSDLVQVSKKGGHGHGHKHGHGHGHKHGHHHGHGHPHYANGKWWYGNRYWGHRYIVRPYNWQVLGCVAVGPFWYCP